MIIGFAKPASGILRSLTKPNTLAMLIVRRVFRVTLFTVLMCALSLACGQKGPLKAPTDTPTDVQMQGQAASE